MTVICNDFFTAFFTRKHKSRLNFIDLLCGGKGLEHYFDAYTEIYILDAGLSKEENAFYSSLMGKHFQTTKDLEDFVLSERGKLPGKQKWTKILEASALSYYLNQSDYKVLELLISDEARQFKIPNFVVNALVIRMK